MSLDFPIVLLLGRQLWQFDWYYQQSTSEHSAAVISDYSRSVLWSVLLTARTVLWLSGNWCTFVALTAGTVLWLSGNWCTFVALTAGTVLWLSGNWCTFVALTARTVLWLSGNWCTFVALTARTVLWLRVMCFVDSQDCVVIKCDVFYWWQAGLCCD